MIIKEHEYRVRRMNAIETLAFRSQIDFSDFNTVYKLYNLILENLEVKIIDKWFPVKEKGRDIYYPNEIENDVETVDKLIRFFIDDYLKPVFTNSNESNK